MMNDDVLKKLPEPLLSWYAQNRRHLPWREEVSPYRTWVSEIMLQQTRVTAVLPYFERFMAAYPTVSDLANADTEELMRLWQGLGYYSRARNLQKAAQLIVKDRNGEFPRTYEAVRALPGIGDYTAGAILSIALGQDIPAVDGNVLRIVSRLTGCEEDVLEDKTRKMMRSWVEKILPPGRSGIFNQAMMDLGAGVCLSHGEPLCAQCPAGEFCTAHQEGRQSSLPVRRKKREKRVEELTVFLLRRGEKIALRKRPDKGLLAGLWEYPHAAGRMDEAQAAAQLSEWGIIPHQWHKKIIASHEFTHIRWEMTGYYIDVVGNGENDWTWAAEEEQKRMAVPSAFAAFTEAIGRE